MAKKSSGIKNVPFTPFPPKAAIIEPRQMDQLLDYVDDIQICLLF